jgi:hypothetical protein
VASTIAKAAGRKRKRKYGDEKTTIDPAPATRLAAKRSRFLAAPPWPAPSLIAGLIAGRFVAVPAYAVARSPDAAVAKRCNTLKWRI